MVLEPCVGKTNPGVFLREGGAVNHGNFVK